MSNPTQQAETLWAQVASAVAARDDEAADRHWREFVRVLWQTMPGAPWVMPIKDHEVRR